MFASIGTVMAQIEQSKRFEFEIKEFEDPFTVINGRENGVLLFRSLDEMDKNGNRRYQFISLDQSLEVRWNEDIFIDKFDQLLGYNHNKDYYYVLFRHTRKNSRDFRLWQISAEDGTRYEYVISNLVNFSVTEFEMSENAAIIGGYYNMNPVVVFFDINSKKTRVLPGIYSERAELQQIKVDEEKSTFLVLLSERTFDKRNTIAVKGYNYQGDLVSNTVLEPDFDKGLVYGRAADFDQDINLMSGTYSTKRSTSYSRGIYIATLDDLGDQNIRYLNYGDLDNFFSYMKAKREKRVKERIERKKVNGKKVKFNYRLLVHEIVTTDDQYLMIGEAFYPKYTSSTMAGYYQFNYSGGTPDGSGMNFAGYRYTHAVVIGFDKQGNFLWDNSFQIEDVVSFTLDQFVHAAILDNNKVALLYLYDNEIRTKIIDEHEVIEGKSFDEIKMSFSNDEAKDNTYQTSALEKWYSDYFFAYGTQKIKNVKDLGVKLNRKVFYINKITYL